MQGSYFHENWDRKNGPLKAINLRVTQRDPLQGIPFGDHFSEFSAYEMLYARNSIDFVITEARKLRNKNATVMATCP